MPLIVRLLLAATLALPVAAPAVNPGDLLPVDQAFAVSAEAAGPDAVRLTWDIAEGYYLYRHAFDFASATANIRLGEAQIPPGKPHVDEFFGRVETYRGQVSVTVPVRGATPGQRVAVTARIQGCADLGVCYPPHEQTVAVSLPIAAQPKAGIPPPGLGPATPFGKGGTTETRSRIIPFSKGDRSAQRFEGISPGEDLLPPEQAFQFEAIALEPALLGVRLTAAPGYYLYRDKIEFKLTDAGGVRLQGVSLPPGQPKHDPHFGDVQVFYGLVEIPIALTRQNPAANDITLIGRFQGCKEGSVCYPPMERAIPVRLQEIPVEKGNSAIIPFSKGDRSAQRFEGISKADWGAQRFEGSQTPLSEQDRLAATLLGGNLWIALGLFFAAGLLLAFTPCVFPMVPILTGILAGQGEGLTTRRAFRLSLVYVLCMALTYTAAGVIAGLFGQNLQALFQQPWILISFAAVFVLLALSMFGFYDLQLPVSWQSKLSQLSNSRRGGTYAGVAVMGLLSALIVGPCVAPPLAAAFIVIGQQGDPVLGGAALFALSIGMGVPLLILGSSAGKLLPKAGPWMVQIKRVFGVLLLALAIWMLSRILPGAVTMLLWGVLLVTCAVWLFTGAGGRGRVLAHGLGAVLLLIGATELLGAMVGGGTWLQPLRGLRAGAPAEARHLAFQPVASAAELDRILASAQRPVMLDFYADWCIECKRMEAYTYPDAQVRDTLSGVLLLKADVTAMDAGDKSLLQRFGLIGPPATLFFVNGEELRRHRLIGYLDAEAFSDHVGRALQKGGSQSASLETVSSR